MAKQISEVLTERQEHIARKVSSFCCFESHGQEFGRRFEGRGADSPSTRGPRS
jgi:hypothetical protein